VDAQGRLQRHRVNAFAVENALKQVHSGPADLDVQAYCEAMSTKRSHGTDRGEGGCRGAPRRFIRTNGTFSGRQLRQGLVRSSLSLPGARQRAVAVEPGCQGVRKVRQEFGRRGVEVARCTLERFIF
jgi:hypothetical protein